MTSSVLADLDELRLRASVLSHYELSWLGAGTAGEGLFAESTRVLVDGVRHWTLADAVRRSAVRQASGEQLRAAWRNVAYRPTDDRQRAIDQMLSGRAVPRPDRLPLGALQALAWVSRWMGDHVQVDWDIDRALAVASLLEPLRALADENFVGREALLRLLRGHLDRPSQPLVVHGVGGIGKSALLARHVLRCTSDALVCYLNFDQVELDPATPSSVIAAMARQLAAQDARFDRLLAFTRDVLRSGDRSFESSGRTIHRKDPYYRLMSPLTQELWDRRVLLVLDTSEEVQRRTDAVQQRFKEMLVSLHRALPRLSIVLGGRSPLGNDEKQFFNVEVPLLSPREATSLLRSLLPFEITSAEAKRVVRAVRPSPLCIRLAAGIMRKRPEQDPFREVAVRLGAVEGELYHRLLGYIENDEVRRLAHPGLTLRVVTPDLIREVLAEPCAVAVPNATKARWLFKALAREAMLVRRSLKSRLEHRQDVRQMMLRGLAGDAPDTVADIHRRAIEYYSRQEGVEARSEELYHRLMSGQDRATLERRWDDAALPGLIPSLDELPPAAKAYLATKSPNLAVSRADLVAADASDRIEQVLRGARSALEQGKFETALAIMRHDAPRFGDRSFEIAELSVQILEALHRYEEALSEAAAQRFHTTHSASPMEFYTLTFHIIRLYEQLDRLREASEEAAEALRIMASAPDTTEFRLIRLRLDVQCLRLARRGFTPGACTEAQLADQALRTYHTVPLRDVRRVPGLLRDLAGHLGERDPVLLRAAIRVYGLDSRDIRAVLDAFGALADELLTRHHFAKNSRAFVDRVADLLDRELVPARAVAVLAEICRQDADDAVTGGIDRELVAEVRPEVRLVELDDLGPGAASIPGMDPVLAARLDDAIGRVQLDHAEWLLNEAQHEIGEGADAPIWLDVSRIELQARAGDLDAAFVAMRRMIRLNTEQPMHALLSGQYALLLQRAGWLAEAVDEYDTALLEMRNVAHLAPVMTRTTFNRGLARLSMGDVTGAIDDFRTVEQATGSDGHPVLQALALRHLGVAMTINGWPLAALGEFDRSRAILRETNLPHSPRTDLDAAETMLAAGLTDGAAEVIRNALPHLRDAELGFEVGVAELRLAAVEFLSGDLAQARVHASAARRRFVRRDHGKLAELAALVDLRASVASGERRRSAQTGALDLAHRLAASGLPDEATVARLLAVRVAIRRRALDEAAALIKNVPRPLRQAPLECRLLLRLCRAELAAARDDHSRVLREARSGYLELAEHPDRLGTLDLLSGTAVQGFELVKLGVEAAARRGHGKAAFEALERLHAPVYQYDMRPAGEALDRARIWSRMRQRYLLEGRPVPAKRDRLPPARPARLAAASDVADQLGSRAMISFLVAEDGLSAVVVTGSVVRMVRLGAAAPVLEATRMLSADVDALAPDHLPAKLVEVASASARRRADVLDSQMLRPIANLIGDRELVIVATGSLWGIPWSVLPSLCGRPLTVAPSATSWLTAERSEPQTRRAAVFVAGVDLPTGVGEITYLTAAHGDTWQLAGEQATVSSVLELLDGAGMAHIAAHGVSEPQNVHFSRLELVDGPLYAHALTGLDHYPRHVVLTASELPARKPRPTEDPFGFASVLLAGGTRTVTASASRLGAEAYAVAMADYHRRLAAGASPAVALAATIAVDPLRRPFICIGSGQA